MKPYRWSRIAAMALLAGAAACESLSPDAQLTSDEVITTDVAVSSGDAIASAIETMVANESVAGLASATADVQAAVTGTFDFQRERTCYDASDAVVTNCTPLSSVRKIVTHVEIDGSRSHTSDAPSAPNWSGAVHRVLDDTLTRNYDTAAQPAEISRTHSSVGSGDDTTTFAGERVTKVMSETTRDSVRAVTWNLPRSQNPFPVSGSIVRRVAVKVTATAENRTETREANLRVEVLFPADGQGNVELHINDKTCNLNLVTHVVSNCQ
jgi:hypothetical protein